jgi:hypothetical protein
LTALEDVLERALDPNVRVARPSPALAPADFEQWIDARSVRPLGRRLASHGRYGSAGVPYLRW